MTTTPTAKQALAAYERACKSHQRKDWRQACHMLAAVVQARAMVDPRAVRAPKPKAGPTLCEFLSERGVNDLGGELRSRDADLWHRAKPFRRRLLRDDGVSLEHAAELAWEYGYFPDVPIPAMDSGDQMHPVTADMLVAAIDRELRRETFGAHHDDPGYWEALEREAA